MSMTYFCPHCNANQLTWDSWEGDRLKVRCQMCCYPIDEGVLRKDRILFGQPTRARHPKILCIDDDKLLLALFTNTLSTHGFVPLTASDGVSGLATARKERPDLILLDIMMPGMDGFAVCQQLRTDPDLRDNPIIMVTAMADPKLNLKGFQAGATLVMRKPFEPESLINTIKTALALRPKPPTP